jgi:hypothetical protein
MISQLTDYSYGASLIPDEDDLKINPIKLAKINDPNGYIFDIIQTKSVNTLDSSINNKITSSKSISSSTTDDGYYIPKFRCILNVIDLDESIEFYTNYLGFHLLKKRSNVNNRPKEASFSAYLSANLRDNLRDSYKINGKDEDEFILELKYHYSTDKIEHDGCNLEVNNIIYFTHFLYFFNLFNRLYKYIHVHVHLYV